MNEVGAIIFSAVLVESIINIIQNIQDKETSWKYWASLVLGLLAGALIAYNWDLDLFRIVGLSAGKLPWVGAVLTGIVLSRGSNAVSDLLGLINSKPAAE